MTESALTTNEEVTTTETAPEGVAGESTTSDTSLAPTEPLPAGGFPDWLGKMEIADDIKSDPALKPFNDIPSLVKSYVHTKRMVGADKIQVPNKYADDSEWTGVFRKLGLPESLDGYELKPELAEGEELNEDFLNGFKEQAFQAGVLPKQAQQLVGWYANMAAQMAKQQAEAEQQKVQEALGSLKNEWGDAYDSKIRAAKATVDLVGDDDFRAYLNETGLGNDPNVIKAFAKIGESALSEDKVIAGSDTKSGGHTPQSSQAMINQVMGDREHPYHDKLHPEHKKAVEEMAKHFMNASA